MFSRHEVSAFALLLLTSGFCCCSLAVAGKDEAEGDNEDTVAAIAYLADIDCAVFPEAQDVLVDNLEKHEFEDVRYAAAKALFKQLQRGRRPLNPLNGWREIPDPFILEQVVRLATFRETWTFDELTEMYADRKVEKECELATKNGRKDLLRGCVSDQTIKALARVAYRKDEFGCWVEPSERVRQEAENGLLVALGADQAEQQLAEILAKPDLPANPMDPVPEPMDPMEVDTSQLRQFTQSLGRSRGPIGANIGFQGRADTANRFNLIDGIGAAPRSRAWVAYQFLSAQNPAVAFGSDIDRFYSEFENLSTINSQQAFQQATGFGQGITPGFDPVDVFNGNVAANAQQLRNEFFSVNTGGKTENFLNTGDTNLYRFGFEYALTPDFSVGMQAQYIMPVSSEVQQPDSFTNPLIVMKHVAYRDDKQVLAGLLGIAPQIPQDEISIVERTSRINPGLLYFKESKTDDRWFMQVGTAFSLPTDPDQTYTWDWALGLGYWLYRDESLINPDIVASENQFLLGIVPQFEVLGKHIIGDTTVRGAFGLNSLAPRAADGYASSRTDASGTLLFDDGTSLADASFVFEEPRHVVDITTAVAFILRDNWTYSLGLSIPVTGGNARNLEFLTALTYGF